MQNASLYFERNLVLHWQKICFWCKKYLMHFCCPQNSKGRSFLKCQWFAHRSQKAQKILLSKRQIFLLDFATFIKCLQLLTEHLGRFQFGGHHFCEKFCLPKPFSFNQCGSFLAPSANHRNCQKFNSQIFGEKIKF